MRLFMEGCWWFPDEREDYGGEKDRDVGYTADAGEAGEGDCLLSSRFS